ncbi:MAG: hypothetical protein KatS3mg110_3918 [Pirellulaceae bacterium]|nr:MAG: hypothetical protein KatS3mg110_3918 [Pirellulaceae bacterium]
MGTDGWNWRDILVWIGFAYLAVAALVRLMSLYRDAVLKDLRRQASERRSAGPKGEKP